MTDKLYLSMLTTKQLPQSQPILFQRRKQSVVQSKFQWKYTGYLLLVAIGGTSFAGGLTYYLLNQNYDIFIQLTTFYAPHILDSLERERLWLNSLLFSMIVGIILFYFYLGFQLAARLIGPVVVLQTHMKALIRGNQTQPLIQIRDDDEFHPLIETYNHLYTSLQNQTRRDLERLRRLNIDPRNQEAYSIWENLIKEHVSKANDPYGDSAPEPDSRRVS